MNFLAHALLSPDDDEILTGNTCADLIRGPLLEGTSPKIKAGIRLHRLIDHHADRHPAFVCAKALIAAPRRRYAGAILDVFFDHCLFRNWASHSVIEFDVFVEKTCHRIGLTSSLLPIRDPKQRERLQRMVESRWLGIYRHRAGLDQAFEGLARRSHFGKALLADAARDLDEHYPAIERSFLHLMPDLQAIAEAFVLDG
ncbi:acyl carrier protein phosphodiesterase [Thioalkalivibrio sp. HK1]|uniref:acyl carrier protein phosphodiesterase n=1 Tax=Thioalkalivibrio sp. HK1 TaxID=1469245 RepID=UPI0004716498|nr:ACP phosphodiesterase [Thioalkalivibrio sp. HK1]